MTTTKDKIIFINSATLENFHEECRVLAKSVQASLNQVADAFREAVIVIGHCNGIGNGCTCGATGCDGSYHEYDSGTACFSHAIERLSHILKDHEQELLIEHPEVPVLKEAFKHKITTPHNFILPGRIMNRKMMPHKSGFRARVLKRRMN